MATVKSNVTWLGFAVRYLPAELEWLKKLPAKEQAFVHEAMGRFNGRLK